MGARYGDRFRQQPPAAPLRDVLDLGDIDDRSQTSDDHAGDGLGPGSPDGRRWHDSWVARLAVVWALLVGAACGAVAWDRWHTYESDVAARGAVDVFASATPLNYPAQDEISIAVRYRNDGEHEIIIRDVRLDTARAINFSDPDVLTIAPGDTDKHTLDLRAQCVDEDVPTWPPPLAVEVETVDGMVRDEIIDSNLASDVVGWLDYACQAQAYEPTFAQSYAEVTTVTPSEDGTAVRAVVEFGVEEDDQLQIEAVQALTGAFSVVYTVGDMSSSTSFHAPPITVVFRVADCALAQQAADDDMSPSVAGSINGGASGRLIIFPSATLAAELVRLTERSCPT